METLVLGLLLLRKMTLYDIKIFLENDIYLGYSASVGSIKFTLKKLLEKEFIQSKEKTDNNRAKKYYSILDAGRAYFMEWLASPIEGQFLNNEEVVKLYFLGFLSKDTREEQMRLYVKNLQKEIDNLTILYQKQTEDSDARILDKDIADNQLQVLTLSIDLLKCKQAKYQKLLEQNQREIL